MSTLLGDARIRVRPDLSSFHSEADRHIGASFKKIAATATALLAGVGAAAFAKSTFDIGREYQNSLNTLQAVSKATDAQLKAVSTTAKQLGSDITLPATSAADAAAAMTELAKGGLNVDQAMSAAKGTLQLAAAAQIEAGQAAEYQAQTLNAFHLEAGQAGRVADVLANAANAASGEISDFALGMSQASAVAASTGISLEDTAATLGVLAKNGIMGSDAGTLLKSALLALQSPSKPAQAAMDDLSLSAYDASGNFVGLSSIFGQLADAQRKMTPEAYAAATSTLFGSDAARLAGIAGHEGAEGFDAMRVAMGTTGAAADVAAAKAKGVGGAIEAFKSQVETFQIDVFERAAPNIEKLVRYAAENFPKVGNALIDGVENSIEWLGKLKDEGVTAFREVRDYLEPLTSEMDDFWDAITATNGPAETLFDLFRLGAGVTLGLLDAARPLVEIAGNLLGAFNDLPGPVQTVVLALIALKVATSTDLLGRLAGRNGLSGALGTAGQSMVGFAQTARANMRLAGDEVGRVGAAAGGLSAAFATYMPRTTATVSNFVAGITSAFGQARLAHREMVTQLNGAGSLSKGVGDLAGFQAAAKYAAEQGVGALRSAAGGLVNFMGGPWGIALAGAGMAIGLASAQIQAAKAKTDEWKAALLEGGRAAEQAARQAKAASEGGFKDFIDALQFGDQESPWEAITGADDDEAFAKAKGQAKEYWLSLDPIAQAQAKVSEWTSTLSHRLGTLGKTHEDTSIAQERLAYWTDLLANRQGDLDEATGKSATSQSTWLAAVEGAVSGFANTEGIYQTLLSEKQEAERVSAQATADSTADASDSWRDHVGDVTVSLGELATKLQEQLDAQANWRTNLGLIAQWAGADVAQYLAKMGTDGVGLVAQMADGTSAEAQRMRDQIRRQIEMGGGEWTTAMGLQMQVMEAVGAAGAGATVQTIADKLGVGVGWVASIVNQYGGALANGLNPLLSSLGKPIIGWTNYRPATPGFIGPVKNADGNLYEKHQAEIAPGGAWRVWAEPETGGEAYIPLAAAKRARSLDIWRETGKRLKAPEVQHFAFGGITDVPRPSSTFPTQPPISSAADGVMEKGYNDVRAWLDANLEPPSASGGSSTGLLPIMAAARTYVMAKYGIRNIGGFARRNIIGTNTLSDHGMGKAIDIMTTNLPLGWAIANDFAFGEAHRQFRAENVIWQQSISSNGGRFVGMADRGSPTQNHRDHVHVDTYDDGGVLHPGMTIVNNASGKPEGVLTNAQLGWLQAAADGGSAPLVGALSIHVGSDADVRDGLDEALFQLRRISRGGAHARRR